MKKLVIADQEFESRLFLGTGAFRDEARLLASIEASGAEMVTLALQRLSEDVCESEIFSLCVEKGLKILPNTAGSYCLGQALATARLAREACQTPWIKLEVLADQETLLPDPVALLEAAEILVKEGFVVLPYCSDDPILCQRLADLGCAAVMPLGAPIGSGLGIRNPHNFSLIRQLVDIPIILDAGIGLPSHVTQALELGVDGILLDSAVARARDPVSMARAMALAWEAGFLAHGAGPMPPQELTRPSSPTDAKEFFLC